jgi:septum formation topological specificity factor MinE
MLTRQLLSLYKSIQWRMEQSSLLAEIKQLHLKNYEQMKKELLAVASKYFEIDPESAECVIKSQGNRRAFISAIVPLLKRNLDDTSDNKPGQGKEIRRAAKKNNAGLSTSAA